MKFDEATGWLEGHLRSKLTVENLETVKAIFREHKERLAGTDLWGEFLHVHIEAIFDHCSAMADRRDR